MADYKTKHAPIDDYPFMTYAPDEDAHTGNIGTYVTSSEGVTTANFTFNDVEKQVKNGRPFAFYSTAEGGYVRGMLLSVAVNDGEYGVFGYVAGETVGLFADSPDEPLTYSA